MPRSWSFWIAALRSFLMFYPFRICSRFSLSSDSNPVVAATQPLFAIRSISCVFSFHGITPLSFSLPGDLVQYVPGDVWTEGCLSPRGGVDRVDKLG